MATGWRHVISMPNGEEWGYDADGNLIGMLTDDDNLYWPADWGVDGPESENETDAYHRISGVWFGFHAYIGVELDSPRGNGRVWRHLHFAPRIGNVGGYYHIPANPPGPISAEIPEYGGEFGAVALQRWTTTRQANEELVELWDELEKERGDWSHVSWNPVHNCWIPVLQFAQEGGVSNERPFGPGNWGSSIQ